MKGWVKYGSQNPHKAEVLPSADTYFKEMYPRASYIVESLAQHTKSDLEAFNTFKVSLKEDVRLIEPEHGVYQSPRRGETSYIL